MLFPVHSIWLGTNGMPELLQYCVATQKHNSGLVLWQWTESMIATNPLIRWAWFLPYTQQALEAKNYAAASDVLRLACLNAYGGVYLDADVEVLASLQKLNDGNFHIGDEDNGNYCGAVMASPKRHLFVQTMLLTYLNLGYSDTFNGKANGTTLLTHAIKENRISNVVTHERDVFYPRHWTDKTTDTYKTKNTLTRHHWAHTWAGK